MQTLCITVGALLLLFLVGPQARKLQGQSPSASSRDSAHIVQRFRQARGKSRRPSGHEVTTQLHRISRHQKVPRKSRIMARRTSLASAVQSGTGIELPIWR